MDNEETTECDGTKDFPHRKGDGSWWENDAQGIALCRVCDKCRKEKLSRYRPEILTGYDQSDVDEPIEPDDLTWVVVEAQCTCGIPPSGSIHSPECPAYD